MRYLIVGCGRVGSTLARLLEADRHEVIVVDENPSAFKRLGQKFTGHVVVGTGIDYDVLKRAGAQTAHGFIAVTNGDNRNVMAALIAQRMFNIKKIVARIYDPTRGMMYRDLGIDTVCPTTVGAKMIRDRLMDGALPLQMTAFVHPQVAGKRVSEVERAGRIRLTTVRRGEDVRIPDGDTLLSDGDEIAAIVAPGAAAEFAQIFHIEKQGELACS
jgi:trk system potassium uptake protein TrkA